MRSAQSGDCVLPPAGAKRCEANHGRTEGEHWTQCARVRRRREEHTLIQRQSWGLSNDSELRMVNWESQSKTPPQSPEDKHICCIQVYLFVLHSKLATSLLVLRHYEHPFLFSMIILHVTSSRFCLYLQNIHLFTYTFSHAHTDAHTRKHTYTMYNQRTRGMATTRHRSLVDRGGRKALLKTLHTPKKMSEKTDIHESKEMIRTHRASSKATRPFLTN